MSIFEPVDDLDEIPTNPYETLVGEGKKYKTPEDLARAAFEKDRFIKQLERETAEMREEIKKKATFDEILTKIRETATSPAPKLSEDNLQNNERIAPKPEDIEGLVSSLLEKKEADRRVKSNRELVQQRLEEVWGVDASLQLNKKARELGVSLDYLARLANENPTIFFKTVDVPSRSVQSSTPTAFAPRSQVQTAPSPDGSVRNQAYYNRIKTSNPVEYFSTKVQNQMMKDALKQGEAFFME